MISVGDQHEEVAPAAGLPFLVAGPDGLHSHPGGIGQQTERGRKRFLASCGDHSEWGWPRVSSNLKSLLETGDLLTLEEIHS